MPRARPATPVLTTPAWAWLLLGWLLGRAWLAHTAAELPDPLSAAGRLRVARECTVEPHPPPPGIPALRDFRRLPGVGDARSLALVRHLWRTGQGSDFGRREVRWEEIEGIGPVTAAALSRAFPTGSASHGSGTEGGVSSRAPLEDGVHSGRSPVMTLTPPESAARDGERPSPAAEQGTRAPAPGPGSRVGPQPDPGPAPGGKAVDDFLRAALDEDAGAGDVTSRSAVPEGARARARLVAKQEGVVAGLPLFVRTFELCDPALESRSALRDGERVRAGDELAVLTGDARALLLAERTGLNLLQRLSGIATRTAQLVDIVRAATENPVRILDTRKTTPGLRALEKYAVRCGGGHNHRFGLFDEVLLKENHIDLAGRPIPEVLADLRQAVGPALRITCEARNPEEARQGVLGGADVVLLDNMTPAEMSALAPELRDLAAGRERPLELEASGGIGPQGLAEVARCGVDRISVGSLTHSVSALDVSLYLEPAP